MHHTHITKWVSPEYVLQHIQQWQYELIQLQLTLQLFLPVYSLQGDVLVKCWKVDAKLFAAKMALRFLLVL